MRNSIIFKFILLGFFPLLMNGCKKKEDNCITELPAQVVAVTGTHTGQVNQPINLSVSYMTSNGCWQSSELKETISGNERYIEVTSTYKGCQCSLLAGTIQANYTFTATQPGTYYLNFWETEDTFLRDTVYIQ
jgi:hypothetical protein